MMNLMVEQNVDIMEEIKAMKNCVKDVLNQIIQDYEDGQLKIKEYIDSKHEA